MEQNQKIKLFASRDFTGNFDTAFAFIKQNYAAILKPLCYLIPILLVSSFFMSKVQTASMDFDSATRYDNPLDAYSSIFTVGFAIAYLLLALVMLGVTAYTISYMALYSKSENGKIESSEVWNKALNVLLPLFAGSILFTILVGIGTILCIIPGVVAYVYLGFYMYVIVIEEGGIIDSLQRSYNLVKNNFWVTLGFGLVILLLVSMINGAFALPTYLMAVGQIFKIDFLTSDIFAYMATLLSTMGYILVYPMMYIAMGVMYFSHRNKLEGVDMETEIDTIGTDNQNTQY